MVLKAVDDVAFALARTGTGVAADVGGSAARVAKKFDPTSLLGNMPGGSFFKNVGIPKVPLKTSKLFHTPDALKGLKKLSIAELVPKNTSDLLTSMSKTIDDVPTSRVDDIAKSLAKIDVGDAASVAKVAEKSSLGKLKKLSETFTKLTKKKATKLADDAFDSKPFKSADEMADSMKKSKGFAKFSDEAADGSKGALKSTDEVADSSKSALKKGDDVIDDAAEQAKKSKLMKALEFAKKHDGKLNLGIMGAFMLSQHINGKVGSDASSITVDELAGDPGTGDASAAAEDAGVSADVITVAEGEEGVMASNAALAGVLALGAASLVL